MKNHHFPLPGISFKKKAQQKKQQEQWLPLPVAISLLLINYNEIMYTVKYLYDYNVI